MSLETYLEKFKKLRVNKSGDHVSPHKASMLLAVIRLYESGFLNENKIDYSHQLLERYSEIFGCVATDRDTKNPYFPFFHLKSDGFWKLHPLSGREAALENLNSARSGKDIAENVAYASLDDELHQLMLRPVTRNLLKEELVVFWFGKHRQSLEKLLVQDEYEKELRNESPAQIKEESKKYDKPIRDAAFRRVVTEVYDYRCAASGRRLVLPGELILVEAAHLIPFSETQDDDPRNGIALTPNYHWAMDRGIISPGPDYKWHVSDIVDSRIADNKFLVELDGKELIMPKLKRFWPREDALEARYLLAKI